MGFFKRDLRANRCVRWGSYNREAFLQAYNASRSSADNITVLLSFETSLRAIKRRANSYFPFQCILAIKIVTYVLLYFVPETQIVAGRYNNPVSYRYFYKVVFRVKRIFHWRNTANAHTTKQNPNENKLFCLQFIENLNFAQIIKIALGVFRSSNNIF